MQSTPVTCGDFRLWNEWRVDTSGPTYEGGETPKYIIDMTTGRRYLNESEETIQDKAETLGCFPGLLASTVVSVAYTVFRVVRLVSCYHFWSCRNKAEDSSQKSEEENQSEVENSSARVANC